MVQTDVGDDRHFRGGDDVGGIQQTAHAALQHDDIRLLPAVILKGDGADQLELRGRVRHALCVGVDVIDHLHQILVRDLLTAELDTLVEAVDVGGGEHTGPIARGVQNGRGHGGGAALAVGTGDVDILQLPVGVAQHLQELRHPVQTGDAALAEFAVDVFNALFQIHIFDSFPEENRAGQPARHDGYSLGVSSKDTTSPVLSLTTMVAVATRVRASCLAALDLESIQMLSSTSTPSSTV